MGPASIIRSWKVQLGFQAAAAHAAPLSRHTRSGRLPVSHWEPWSPVSPRTGTPKPVLFLWLPGGRSGPRGEDRVPGGPAPPPEGSPLASTGSGRPDRPAGEETPRHGAVTAGLPPPPPEPRGCTADGRGTSRQNSLETQTGHLGNSREGHRREAAGLPSSSQEPPAVPRAPGAWAGPWREAQHGVYSGDGRRAGADPASSPQGSFHRPQSYGPDRSSPVRTEPHLGSQPRVGTDVCGHRRPRGSAPRRWPGSLPQRAGRGVSGCCSAGRRQHRALLRAVLALPPAARPLLRALQTRSACSEHLDSYADKAFSRGHACISASQNLPTENSSCSCTRGSAPKSDRSSAGHPCHQAGAAAPRLRPTPPRSGPPSAGPVPQPDCPTRASASPVGLRLSAVSAGLRSQGTCPLQKVRVGANTSSRGQGRAVRPGGWHLRHPPGPRVSPFPHVCSGCSCASAYEGAGRAGPRAPAAAAAAASAPARASGSSASAAAAAGSQSLRPHGVSCCPDSATPEASAAGSGPGSQCSVNVHPSPLGTGAACAPRSPESEVYP